MRFKHGLIRTLATAVLLQVLVHLACVGIGWCLFGFPRPMIARIAARTAGFFALGLYLFKVKLPEE